MIKKMDTADAFEGGEKVRKQEASCSDPTTSHAPKSQDAPESEF
jgi:hypothetical protein